MIKAVAAVQLFKIEEPKESLAAACGRRGLRGCGRQRFFQLVDLEELPGGDRLDHDGAGICRWRGGWN